jgi:hypothetical protein
MKKGIKNQLTFILLILISFFLLSSCNNKKATNESKIQNILTVKTIGDSAELFDLLIIGIKQNSEVFFKREKSLKTPFELELETGEYSIVIHNISIDGKIIGKIEKLIDGKLNAYASFADSITLLTIDRNNNLSASGM